MSSKEEQEVRAELTIYILESKISEISNAAGIFLQNLVVVEILKGTCVRTKYVRMIRIISLLLVAFDVNISKMTVFKF